MVIVLGGTGGIGSEVAAMCAARGASVAVVGRSVGPVGEAIVNSIGAQGGVGRAYAVDITDEAAIADLTEAVSRDLGTVDGLVNSAAVMANGGFLETPDSTWREVIAVDLLSVVSACRAVLPGMVEAGRGSIVNVSTRLADTGAADAAVYASAKAGVVTLSRSLAAEFGPAGVRVNVVSPGTVATRMGRAVIESSAGQARRHQIPLRRFATPAEVAEATAFLLSNAASGITGQTLRINAGEFMA
ncbi:SDR family oxidoreductase [Microbacterium sp. BWT-B31]|uniref:SDR family NAD(P)-dependent oxidoreductase n=1 Tax=Microbacterium sp. BWT-B31 TaxID=3232072 RepID=UPI0035274848